MSVNYLIFTQKNTPRSGLIEIKKPVLEANLSVLNPLSLMKIHINPMSCKTMMILSLRRKKVKNWLLKSARLKARKQLQQKKAVLVVFIASI